MTHDGYFDDDEGAAFADTAAMARRQLTFSMTVAFALLALAGLIAVSAPHDETAKLAPWNKIVETAPLQDALPALKALTPQ